MRKDRNDEVFPSLKAHEIGIKSAQMLVDQVILTLQPENPLLTTCEKKALVDVLRRVLTVSDLSLQDDEDCIFHMAGLTERMYLLRQNVHMVTTG